MQRTAQQPAVKRAIPAGEARGNRKEGLAEGDCEEKYIADQLVGGRIVARCCLPLKPGDQHHRDRPEEGVEKGNREKKRHLLQQIGGHSPLQTPDGPGHPAAGEMIKQHCGGHLAQGQSRDNGHDAPAGKKQAETEKYEDGVFRQRAHADELHLFGGREHGAAPVGETGKGQQERQEDDNAQGPGIGADQPRRTSHQHSSRRRARQPDDQHVAEIGGRRGGILRRIPRQHRGETEAGDQLEKAHQGEGERDRPESAGAEIAGEQDPEQRGAEPGDDIRQRAPDRIFNQGLQHPPSLQQ
ncbi:MAG: hypothetical protein BWY77_01543 [bacterium ADurb.Bin431]|nr:MAG: hypothetical protein BWY77_01543 [bacterium ADurb.Bin431]